MCGIAGIYIYISLRTNALKPTFLVKAFFVYICLPDDDDDDDDDLVLSLNFKGWNNLLGMFYQHTDIFI